MIMSNRTVTRTVEDDLDPDAILAVLMNPKLIPQWAPVFADTVESVASDEWQITKNGERFVMHLAASAASRTVDYLREIAPGRRGGAYIRVLPRPGGGSVVAMTLPITANADAESVTAVLVEELKSLVEVAKSLQSTR